MHVKQYVDYDLRGLDVLVRLWVYVLYMHAAVTASFKRTFITANDF